VDICPGAMKAPDYSFKLPGGKRLFLYKPKNHRLILKTPFCPLTRSEGSDQSPDGIIWWEDQ